jgi:hypothetical protein
MMRKLWRESDCGWRIVWVLFAIGLSLQTLALIVSIVEVAT